MSKVVDQVMAWLKWPVALCGVLLLPALAFSLWDVVQAIAHRPRPLYPFLTGAAAYLAAWWLLFRRPSFGAFFSTLEHELTHAIFAWATFHKVVAFRATWSRGGHIQFLGKGNWLISIAPYFFPTLSVVVMIVLSFLPAAYVWWGSAALGGTVAYHATSTWSETHRHQKDLQDVGFAFVLCFLPAANALAYGLLLSFASGGLRPLGAYLHRITVHADGGFEIVRQVLRI